MTEYDVRLHFSLPGDFEVFQVATWLHSVIQKAGGMLVGVVKVEKKESKR